MLNHLIQLNRIIEHFYNLENENGNPGEMSSSSIANDDFSREEIKEGSSKSTSKILEERRKSGANMSEKLSNVSSEDIAMRSAGIFRQQFTIIHGCRI